MQNVTPIPAKIEGPICCHPIAMVNMIITGASHIPCMKNAKVNRSTSLLMIVMIFPDGIAVRLSARRLSTLAIKERDGRSTHLHAAHPVGVRRDVHERHAEKGSNHQQTSTVVEIVVRGTAVKALQKAAPARATGRGQTHFRGT